MLVFAVVIHSLLHTNLRGFMVRISHLNSCLLVAGENCGNSLSVQNKEAFYAEQCSGGLQGWSSSFLLELTLFVACIPAMNVAIMKLSESDEFITKRMISSLQLLFIILNTSIFILTNYIISLSYYIVNALNLTCYILFVMINQTRWENEFVR